MSVSYLAQAEIDRRQRVIVVHTLSYGARFAFFDVPNRNPSG